MKKTILTIFFIHTWLVFIYAQEESSSVNKKGNFRAEANNYVFSNDYIFMPVLKTERDKLHFEARYNYEDMETFSGWIGYNFVGDESISFTFTPMIGGVVGLSNGMAGGLEATIGYNNFEFYSEVENFFDLNNRNNNFFYAWSDVSYTLKDWIWFGISGQRTRLYQTNLELQKGLFVGAGWKSLELTTYVYNLAFDDPFLLVTLSAGF